MKWEKSVRLHEEKHTPKKEKDFWRSKLDEAIEDLLLKHKSLNQNKGK